MTVPDLVGLEHLGRGCVAAAVTHAPLSVHPHSHNNNLELAG
jgi:hypothetical protein